MLVWEILAASVFFGLVLVFPYLKHTSNHLHLCLKMYLLSHSFSKNICIKIRLYFKISSEYTELTYIFMHLHTPPSVCFSASFHLLTMASSFSCTPPVSFIILQEDTKRTHLLSQRINFLKVCCFSKKCKCSTFERSPCL